jgi:hypothetical protein
MAEIDIDRMSLRFPAMSPQRGERIARKVANGLTDSSLSSRSSASLANIDLHLPSNPDDGDDALASRIAAEIIRHLERIS